MASSFNFGTFKIPFIHLNFSARQSFSLKARKVLRSLIRDMAEDPNPVIYNPKVYLGCPKSSQKQAKVQTYRDQYNPTQG